MTTHYHGSAALYHGLFGDNTGDPLPALDINVTPISTPNISLNNQSLELIPNQSITLHAPDGSNANYFLSIAFVGDPLRQIDIFSTTLESLMALAQLDNDSEVDDVNFVSERFPVWLLGKADLETIPAFKLTVWHVILIAEAIAKYCVVSAAYQELIWDFKVDGAVAARGCMTLPTASRRDCAGLRIPLDQSLGKNTQE